MKFGAIRLLEIGLFAFIQIDYRYIREDAVIIILLYTVPDLNFLVDQFCSSNTGIYSIFKRKGIGMYVCIYSRSHKYSDRISCDMLL